MVSSGSGSGHRTDRERGQLRAGSRNSISPLFSAPPASRPESSRQKKRPNLVPSSYGSRPLMHWPRSWSIHRSFGDRSRGRRSSLRREALPLPRIGLGRQRNTKTKSGLIAVVPSSHRSCTCRNLELPPAPKHLQSTCPRGQVATGFFRRSMKAGALDAAFKRSPSIACVRQKETA